MPWKSDAQRRWGNSPSGHEALGDKGVEEWNKATKGKTLPEKKMADGGEVMSEPGLQDATVSDFGPILAAMLSGGTSEAPEAAEASLEIKGTPEIVKSLADKVVPESQNPANQFAPDLRKMWGETAAEQSGTSPAARGVYVNPHAFTGPQNMFAHGGEVKMADGGDTLDALQGALGSVAQPIEAAGSAIMGMNPLNALAQRMAVGGVNQQLNPSQNPMQPPTPPPQPDQAFINQLNAGTAIQPSTPAPTPNPVTQTSQAAQNLPPTSPSIYQGMTAEDRAALMQKLIAQKSSPGMLGAGAAAGLGDAITSAFGKAPTNALGNLRQAEQQNVEQRTGILDTERQQKMQDVAANMMVMKSNPNSSMSAMARQMYSQMTGKQAPSGISAAQIETLNPLIEKTIETSAQKAIAGGAQAVEAGKALYGETWGDMIKELFGASGTEAGAAALENAAGTSGATPTSTAGWSVKR